MTNQHTKPNLATQYEQHTQHPPRVISASGFFVVQAYSPVTGGYMLVAEWRTKEQADQDLKTWEESWNHEQASFKAALKA